MSEAEPGQPRAPAGGPVGRILSLLLHPAETWDLIADEPATIEGLYRTWVLPLAALPAAATAIGLISFHGFVLFGTRYQPSFLSIIGGGLAEYLLILIGTYLLAVVIDVAAPRFSGEHSLTQAFKLVAYSGTPAWVFGLCALLPMAGELIAFLGGLYSLYILYLGLPKLMRSDPEGNLTYFGLILGVSVLMFVVINTVSHNVSDVGGPVRIY
ncbi:MAG: YIP1 family protein [Proteobacteria bacterium]|nr:YIP1 family protein [Pseudomonadota bacterium]